MCIICDEKYGKSRWVVGEGSKLNNPSAPDSAVKELQLGFKCVIIQGSHEFRLDFKWNWTESESGQQGDHQSVHDLEHEDQTRYDATTSALKQFSS